MPNTPLSIPLTDDGSIMIPSQAAVGEVTQLLNRWDATDASDQEKLFNLLYPELKRIAEFRMKGERPDHTLEATALVHEFFVRLTAGAQQPWQNRVHFLAVASRAMRRILVDYARTHNAERRGGQQRKVQIEDENFPEPRAASDILEIHELLEQLAAEDQRMADIVELRYFGGLSTSEVAGVLGLGERTIQRDWQVARAWLYARIHKSAEPAKAPRGKGDAS